MADETTATPAETPVEPAPAATTPPAETKPEPQPETKPEPDYRAAYVGLQRSQNKLHGTVEGLKQTNTDLVEALRIVKEGQSAILRETAGEEKAKEFEAQQVRATTQSAQLRAAKAAEQALTGQFNVLVRAITAAGLDPKDRSLWPQDTTMSPDAWYEETGRLIEDRLTAKKAEERQGIERSITAKSAKEIEAEAEAIAQRKVQESGVDRIDTAKGGAATSTAERIAKMDPNSKEFKDFYANVVAGRQNL